MKPTRRLQLIGSLFLMLFLHSVQARATDRDQALQRDVVDSILVNQTVTVAGQEFHATFAALWSDKPALPAYVLAIRERPSASRGTTVEIEHDSRIVFRAYLPPARAQIRALAEQAVDIVYQTAMAAQVGQLLRDDDLAGDEF